MSFNSGSLLDLDNRTFLAKAIAQANSDILCSAQSWLSTSVPNSDLILHDYHFYRNDRQATETHKTRHGGVIIAVRGNIDTSQFIPYKKSDVSAVQLMPENSPVLLGCLKNAPTLSAYQWTSGISFFT